MSNKILTIFDRDILSSTCDVIVNPVNCEGIEYPLFGKRFMDKFPKMYAQYQISCSEHEYLTGVVRFCSSFVKSPKYIANFPTKLFYYSEPDIDIIRMGMISLSRQLILFYNDVNSIALPTFDCGNGEFDLKVGDVIKVIEESLMWVMERKNLRAEVYVI